MLLLLLLLLAAPATALYTADDDILLLEDGKDSLNKALLSSHGAGLVRRGQPSAATSRQAADGRRSAPVHTAPA
jgi:hypothetical protein